ncbi:MAG: hypothetical protein LBF93_03665 [Zoogloeaceae bacterium]|jgi:hypothetical protein|nr:hypothetical protein [Zoogloeaceae bacterium]
MQTPPQWRQTDSPEGLSLISCWNGVAGHLTEFPGSKAALLDVLDGDLLVLRRKADDQISYRNRIAEDAHQGAFVRMGFREGFPDIDMRAGIARRAATDAIDYLAVCRTSRSERHFAENLGRFGALQSIEPLFLASRSILSPLIAKVRQAANDKYPASPQATSFCRSAWSRTCYSGVLQKALTEKSGSLRRDFHFPENFPLMGPASS